MIFKATSFVIPLVDGPGEDGLDPDFFEGLINKLEGLVFGGSGTESAAAPLSAIAIWSAGTCHVAFYKKNAPQCEKRGEERRSNQSNELKEFQIDQRTYHDLSKSAGAQNLVRIIRFFLHGARGLHKQRFCESFHHLGFNKPETAGMFPVFPSSAKVL